MTKTTHMPRDRPAATDTCGRLELEIGGVMERRRYTTAEAFAMVASGEREEMRAPPGSDGPEERIRENKGGCIHCEFRYPENDEWRESGVMTRRSDWYDPNEAEEPATEPQWRPCSKAWALRNPEQSEAHLCRADHSWCDWFSLDHFNLNDTSVTFEFRTYAPIPPGYLCEVPEGTRAIEVRITDARGRESSSGTIEVSGKAGFVRVVELEVL